ncbi:MAG: DUF362 domain-containing protein [bacterium]
MKDGNGDAGNISRRVFIKSAAKTVAGLGALPLIGETALGADAAGAAAAGKDARVCLVQSKTPIVKGDEAKAIFKRMLDEGVKNIANGGNVDKYWRASFKPDDRVAIKVNGFGYKGNCGSLLAGAICERLKGAGVKPENVVIYENSDGSLKGSGYKINFDGPGFRCYGTDRVGHMEKAIKSGACEARYTKILERCTALINMPTLKSHNMAGVTISLKNHYGSFSNPRDYHGNDCDPFIADINTADIIRNKTRLVVCDAVKVLFCGGPDWVPAWTADFNGILVSADPVALDSIGYKIIKKLRKESGIRPLPYNPEPKQIKTAQKNGIGIADVNRIDFQQIMV